MFESIPGRRLAVVAVFGPSISATVGYDCSRPPGPARV